MTATGGSQYDAKPRSIGKPINTIYGDNRSAVIVPTLVRVAHGSIDKFGKKRGRGDHDITEPMPTQSTPHEFAVIEPLLVTTGHRERTGQAPCIPDLTDPIHTHVARRGRPALIREMGRTLRRGRGGQDG